MRRQQIDFAEFKKNFIEHPDGYFPVCSELDEDDNGNFLKVMNIDFICEWRLVDGKLLFLEVPFENEQEFNEIVEYLKVAAGLLNKAILKRIDELKYSAIGN